MNCPRQSGTALSRVYQNLREGTAPPCRGAGPTGLRGFTPTDTHIKYVFVDIRPLRRFAPPPLQGGGVYFATPSIEYQDFQPEKSFPHFCTKQCLPHVSPYDPQGFGNPPLSCAGLQNPSQQRKCILLAGILILNGNIRLQTSIQRFAYSRKHKLFIHNVFKNTFVNPKIW